MQPNQAKIINQKSKIFKKARKKKLKSTMLFKQKKMIKLILTKMCLKVRKKMQKQKQKLKDW